MSLAIAETEGDKTTVTTNNNQQAETEKSTPPASTFETPDSFDPTENLSQDVPTAFPVDI
tara:strand:- start:11315 stop:11494 length:180 start_codon:yes stop_codon:yes gene_type:complete